VKFTFGWLAFRIPLISCLTLLTCLSGSLAVPLGDEFQVNSFTTSAQIAVSVGLDADGNAILVWTCGGGQDGDLDGMSFCHKELR